MEFYVTRSSCYYDDHDSISFWKRSSLSHVPSRNFLLAPPPSPLQERDGLSHLKVSDVEENNF
ncbi:hypothetical protein LSTR_LSTR008402 [Laodelphax striatellus]|uniref:Uncharacterized protein n=1 Tax=Laodelphax striatellus TaxID=195883 RepID=A0A482XTE7_LAOST|nr:hypothetical protein LSTR_LSTR008402 [Laodelphax striatellus]